MTTGDVAMCEVHQRAMMAMGERNVCPSCLAHSSAPALEVWGGLAARAAASERSRRLALAAVPQEFIGRGFDEFIADGEQAAAVVKGMRNFARGFGRHRHVRKGFMFIGPSGTAKTHLACAVVQQLMEDGYSACYTSLPTFTREVRAAFGRPRAVDDLVRKLIGADLLVLDEIDLHGSADADYNMLYDIVNGRYVQAGKPIIAISNRPLATLSVDLHERLISRILADSEPIEFTWQPRRQGKSRLFSAPEACHGA